MATRKKATAKSRKQTKKSTKRRRTSVPKKPGAAARQVKFEEKLRGYLRANQARFLADPNITSVGVGFRQKDGKPTQELCVQFTVRKKYEDATQLEGAGTKLIPESLQVEGYEVPTQVLQRSFRPGYDVVRLEAKDPRKARLETLVPGISVSHPAGTAGTLGLVVFDQRDSAPCMLSNWHVLNTEQGKPGDTVVQPGPHDDSDVSTNRAGVLLRSHLGAAGDCAIARIDGRGFDDQVLDLGVRVRQLARPSLGDRVVKSGRTTAITYGVVTRVDVASKINYGGMVGERLIGGFEIGPDPDRPAPGNEISMGGDSGSAWLVAEANGKASDIMVGLHFAGEGEDNPEEHALACYAHSVFQKLEISLADPGPEKALLQAAATGYNEMFLGERVSMPRVTGEIRHDAVELDGSPLLHYMHFSLSMSESRRMARFVAWNIDGDRLRKISRKGIPFTFDARIDEGHQLGDDIYADNKLDRGHLARRADLCWGELAQARQANRDSFFFTNITPQHQAFNQSSRAGLWGELEDAIFEELRVSRLRVSAMAGPIFKQRDPTHRGARVPSDFWKLLAYVDEDDGRLKVKAYILSQDDLLNDIEALALDEFRLFEVAVEEIERRTRLEMAGLRKLDAFATGELPEAVSARGDHRPIREVRSRAELLR